MNIKAFPSTISFFQMQFSKYSFLNVQYFEENENFVRLNLSLEIDFQ